MDNWRVAVLGDGGVGKTALAVQVSTHRWLRRIPISNALSHSLHSTASLVSTPIAT